MKQDRLWKIFSRIPPLATERLLLRGMKVSDADDMYEYAKDPAVSEYLLWDAHPSKKYTERYLAYMVKGYLIGKNYDWAITIRLDDGRKKMIGTCGFTSFDPANEAAEIGYVLNPAYWGKGIAREAVLAVLRFGFDTMGLQRIEAKYIIGNDRSRRVMEKCGMTFEGVRRSSMIVKEKRRDIGVCSILREEWDSHANENAWEETNSRL